MSHVKLSTKLFSAVLALLLIGTINTAFVSWSQREVGQELDNALTVIAPTVDQLNSVRASAWELLAALRGTLVFSVLKDHQRQEASVVQYQAARENMRRLFQTMRPLLDSDADRRILSKLESSLNEFDPVALEYISVVRAGQLDRVAALVPRIYAFSDSFHQTANQFRDEHLAELKEADARADAHRATSNTVSLLLGLILLVIGAAAVFVVRGIVRTLTGAVAELGSGAAQVASAAGQISSSSQSLARGAAQQASALEQTAASSEEINAMASKNSENSQSAARLVTASQQRFVQVNRALDEMIVAMAEITTQSTNISKIIKVIDEIAFQTNILALNAAVEAARAGEVGLGFAVVADEVRNLAQRSAQAARDTASLIEESIAKSHRGKEKVDTVAASIRSVTEEAVQVKTLVDEVSAGSNEQTRGIEQIARAIAEMQSVTQQTAAGGEQSAAAATELNAQAEALNQIVASLTAMVGRAA